MEKKKEKMIKIKGGGIKQGYPQPLKNLLQMKIWLELGYKGSMPIRQPVPFFFFFGGFSPSRVRVRFVIRRRNGNKKE